MAEIPEAFGYQHFSQRVTSTTMISSFNKEKRCPQPGRSISGVTVSGTMTIICGTVIMKTGSGSKNVIIHGMMMI